MYLSQTTIDNKKTRQQYSTIRKHDDSIQPSHDTNDSTTWSDGTTYSDTNCNTPFSQYINKI